MEEMFVGGRKPRWLDLSALSHSANKGGIIPPVYIFIVIYRYLVYNIISILTNCNS